MKQLGWMTAEWLRILLILVIGLPLMNMAELLLLSLVDAQWNDERAGLALAANLLIVFVMYRNKLQFGGWYRSPRNRPLQRRTTWLLAVVSVILLLAAIESS